MRSTFLVVKLRFEKPCPRCAVSVFVCLSLPLESWLHISQFTSVSVLAHIIFYFNMKMDYTNKTFLKNNWTAALILIMDDHKSSPKQKGTNLTIKKRLFQFLTTDQISVFFIWNWEWSLFGVVFAYFHSIVCEEKFNFVSTLLRKFPPTFSNRKQVRQKLNSCTNNGIIWKIDCDNNTVAYIL